MRWCTIENIHLDRVASLWLIRRYVDPEAEFLFVPRGIRPGEVPPGRSRSAPGGAVEPARRLAYLRDMLHGRTPSAS